MAEGSSPPDVRGRSLPLIPSVSADEVPADCTTCGRCCASQDPKWIRVFAVDDRRMDDHARSFVVERDGERVMRFTDGRCDALRSTDGRHVCAIYEMRPDACRWLERGSTTCREILHGG